MDLTKIIRDNFEKSINTKQATLEKCNNDIIRAGKMLLDVLTLGNKILICGNGGSAADAQHFATELVLRYETDRISLPAISLSTDTSLLTAIPNDVNFDKVFSRQVEGLGKKGDLLFGISTSGNSGNVINAIKTAQQQNLKVIVLSGKGGGAMRNQLQDTDVEICVPDSHTGRIQEMHILVIHTLCNMIDIKFSGT